MSRNITIRGIDELIVKIDGLATRAMNPTPVFEKIGKYLAITNLEAFTTNGASNGSAWKPLSPNYKQWKVRHGMPFGILVRTGALRASYTGRPMGVEIYGKQEARYGSNIRYAHFHQLGTRKMPARKVMVVNRKMRSNVKTIVVDYLFGEETDFLRLK